MPFPSASAPRGYLSAPFFEALEQRLLLTTLIGGDIFEYLDAGGDQYIRVALEGDIIAEFIAGLVDPVTNELTLGELPGAVMSSTIGRSGNIFGGPGGADGAELLGAISITDADFSPGTFLWDEEGVDEILVQALASMDALGNGRTFGFNVTDVTLPDGNTRTIIQVLSFSNVTGAATVEGMIQQASLNEDVMSVLSGVALPSTPSAFAVDPTTGIAYAISQDDLYSINRFSGVVALEGAAAGGAVTNIEAMAFNSTGDLFVIGFDPLNLNQSTLAEINPVGGGLIGSIGITDGVSPIYDLYLGMAFDPSDQLFAVTYDTTTDPASSDLHSIDTGTGVATYIGDVQVATTDALIHGLAFAEDYQDQTILVGMDLSQIDDTTLEILPRLVEISTTSAAAIALSEPGAVAEVYGLSSYTEAGQTRPLLFAADTGNLYRGSPVSLPVDPAGVSEVESIEGADFRPRSGDPEDNLLYFVARDNDSDRLYTIDVEQTSRSAIQNTVTYIGDISIGDSAITLTSITWRDVATPEIYAYRVNNGVGEIVEIDPATGAATFVFAVQTVDAAGNITEITDVSGIEFINGDPDTIYAVRSNGSGSELLALDLATGGITELGSVTDADDDEDPIRGEDIQGLTWNPVLVNPFTGDIGVLIASDATSDEIIYIDSRHRFAGSDLFAIYIAQASEGASIAIATVPDPDQDPRDMQPFSGNVGQIRIINSDGDLVLFNPPGGTGAVYIGARTLDVDPDDDDEDQIPIIVGNLDTELGVRPAAADDLPADPTNDVSAGVRSVESLLKYVSPYSDLDDRLLGMNLDEIREMAVARDGTIVVIDSDRVDENGNPIPGDQIATVNGTFGFASVPVDITAAGTGIALGGIQGLDYGDVNMDGVEELFAIMSVYNNVPSASVGGDFGADLFINPQALTVTIGNVMYVVDANAGGSFDLYRINRTSAGSLVPGNEYDFLGEIYDVGGPTAVDDVFALDAHPLTGLLYAVGEDIDGDQALYIIDINSQNLDGDPGDEVAATRLFKLDGGGVADPAVGLAFDSSGTVLYAVLDVAGTHTLFTIDLSDGSLTEVGGPGGGAVIVAATPAIVDGMDIDPNGNIIAIDRGLGAGNARLIVIHPLDPSLSSEMSAPGSVSDDFAGFGSDGLGFFYTVNTLGVGTDDEIWVSPGSEPTLGTLDPSSGVFTQIGVIAGGLIGGVNAMAFSLSEGSIAGQQGLYIIDPANTLYEIDPTDGSLVTAGDGLFDTTGLGVDIHSMDFNQNNELFAHDRSGGRLVDIDLSTLGWGWVAVGQMYTTQSEIDASIGTMRLTVGAMAYDYSQDRWLAVDNALGGLRLSNESGQAESSALMELLGTDSDSAAGQMINRIMIGGTVTGRVNLAGSIDTFYAGWIITGYAHNLPTDGELMPTLPNYIPDNFSVTGDVRNIISKSSIGTGEGTDDRDEKPDPDYVSGFDLQVGGKLGQLWAMDTLIGGVDVENQEHIDNMHVGILFQQEVESKWDDNITNVEGVAFEAFDLFALDGSFFNDSFLTPQYLGSIRDGTLGEPDVIRVDGELWGAAEGIEDVVDYYAVGLMAGQTVSVQLIESGVMGLLRVGVLDPDGRVIATNYCDVDPENTTYEPFSFTADRPGAYRFAIAQVSNDLFTEDTDTLTRYHVRYGITVPYQLRIDGAGDLGVGGIVGGRDVFNIGWTPGFRLHRGDFGSVYAEQNFFSIVIDDIQVDNGNIRAVVAGEIGIWDDTDDEIYDYPLVKAPFGDAGLFQSLNTLMGIVAQVGGDIQTVDAETFLWVDLTAGGGLGVLRAGRMDPSMYTEGTSKITVDSDGVGFDGIIDLIDVDGDFGRAVNGGPQITIGGPGGNVRYIRVSGIAYADHRLGGGVEDFETLAPGAALQVVDDSGATIRVTPTPSTYDLFTGAPVDTPELSYRTHGIYGSGGVVLIDVISTGGLTASAQSGGINSFAEISRIELAPPAGVLGRAVIIQPDGTLELEPDLGINFSVAIVGQTPIDVFEVDGPVGGPTVNFTSIANNTGGEIVNVTAATIGTLSSNGTIGLAKNHTNAAVNPIEVLDPVNVFPFDQQHIGIVSGNIINVRSRMGVGNLIVDGSIGMVTANAAGSVDHTDGVFEGIAAPIYATGDIGQVKIGEGIAPSGSGNMSHAGIYALGSINRVTGNGLGADIRGNIVAEGGIGRVVLHDGSIVNANIQTVILGDSPETAAYYLPAAFPVESQTVSTAPIGSVSINGVGGIIGGYLRAHDIGNITVKGFGIFNSLISCRFGEACSVGNTSGDGFGIRDVEFRGGASFGDIIATGRGNLLNSTSYSPTVRYSEVYGYDPLTGTGGWDPLFNQRIDRRTDIHEFLGTSAFAPLEVSGMIEDVAVEASRNLGLVKAYQINDSVFDAANSIAGIATLDEIDGLQVTTGALGYFKPNGDVSGLLMNVAGRIDRITINGDLKGGSQITANGPNGDIRDVRITGDMDGDIIAMGIIRTITIGGDLTGDIIVEAANGGRLALRTLKLGGSLASGSLDINGHVGTIDVAHHLGLAGDMLHIVGDLRSLRVGTSNLIDGSSLGLDLDVVGNLGSLDVTGKIEGNVFVGGSLSRATVRADGATLGTNIISGPIAALGGIRSLTITDGDVESDITSGTDFGTFRLTNGDVNSAATIASSFGDIRSVTISGGDLLGAIRADNGTINSITINASDLGPASAISAQYLKTLRIAGSVLGGATIEITNELNRLQVGGDISSGASVTVGSARTVQIGRDLAGELNLGYYARGSTLTISRDLSGALTVDGDARLTVGRHVSGTVSIGEDLTALTITGSLLGGVFVDGESATLRLGAMNGGVLTTGYDVRSLDVAGVMVNSLVQIGISRGDDDLFGTGDLNETGRMGNLRSFTARGVMAGSILAAGGNIDRATLSGGMTNSSVSSGLNLGGSAITAVLADATPLADAAERNAARSGADRQLFWGNLGTAVVGGAGMVNSDITAGIDPGADGDFANPATNSIASSLTGGQSSIKSVQAIIDVNSTVLADAGIQRNNAVGLGTINPNVTYTVGVDLTVANPLAAETLVGTAIDGTPFTYVTFGGHVVTVTVQGNGQVDAYNAGGAVDTNDVIESLVLSGTDSRTRITITTSTPGAVGIGRILTADDATLNSLTFDGDLVGDGSTDPDLWIDGPLATFSFRDMGDDWTGQIGGDVTNLTMQTQGSGALYIGGRVRTMNIFDSGSDPLLEGLALAPTDDIITMTFDSVGNGDVWVYDSGTGNITQVNVDTGAIVAGPFALTDNFTGSPVDLSAMDYLNGAPDVLYGLAELYAQSPTEQVGGLSAAAISLGALAVDGNGRVVAVQNVGGVDVLVEINLTDGSADPIGTLMDVFANTYNNNVLELFFDDVGDLFGLIDDRDGSGGAYAPPDGIALVKIQTVDSDEDGFLRVTSPTSDALPGIFLSGGGVTNDFRAAAIEPVPPSPFPVPFATAYAIRRDLLDTQDELVTIANDGTVTLIGTVQINAADTNVIGMGFDEAGNLIGYNNDGVSAGLIGIDTTDPTNNSGLITTADALDPTIDAFALARSGTNYATYAYDTDDVVGGMFFTNPGTVSTFGVIDTTTGAFTQLRPLAEDSTGTPLFRPAIDMAVDNAGTGTNLFVITQDGRLFSYEEGDGSFLADLGIITDANTLEVLSVTSIEFDDATGELLGLDARFNRLVTIEHTYSQMASIGDLGGDFNVQGLTVLSDGTMYAVNDNGGSFELYRFSRDPDGQITAFNLIGAIDDGTNPVTDIHAMVAGASGIIYLVGNRPAVNPGGDQELFSIDKTTGEVTVIADLTDPAVVIDTMEALALGQDGTTLYAVRDQGGTHTLYTINMTTGLMTEVVGAALGTGEIRVDNDGDGVPDDTTAIVGTDFTPGGALVAIDTGAGAGTGRPIKINLADPGLSTPLSPANSVAAGIAGYAADSDGVFYTVDSTASPDTVLRNWPASGVALMERGAADGSDLTSLAYDPDLAVAGFFTFSDADDRFMEFRGTDQDALGGITLNSVDRLTIGGGSGYGGRIVATGNTISSVTITGNFTGSLISGSDIKRYTQTGGNFGGLLASGRSVGSMSLRDGSVLVGGTIVVDGDLKSLQVGGSFAGTLSVFSSSRLQIGGAGESTADLEITDQVRTLSFGGAFNGIARIGKLGRGTISGALGSAGWIYVTGDATSLTVSGGAALGSWVGVNGYIRMMTVGGVHSGVIAVRQGMGTGRFGHLNWGFVGIGEDTRTLQVSGSASDSVISFGTWIGADGIYNTTDDVITGGSVRSVSIGGYFRDSGVVAGVLPHQNYGPGIPTDMRSYVGNPIPSDISETDSAEAGGVYKSYINSLRIGGAVISTLPGAGWQSVAAAADGIGRVTSGAGGAMLYQRVYGDPFGAPTMVKVESVNAAEARITFSEELNTASLILSEDLDDDGTVTGAPDVLGTVLVVDGVTGEVMDDLSIAYTTETLSSGRVRGVLIIRRPEDFAVDQVVVTLSGSLVDPAIYDRSGLRSALRDLNQDGIEGVGEDQPGTILDGDDDGEEAPSGTYVISFADMPGSFTGAQGDAPLPLVTDGNVVIAGNEFQSGYDVDVWRFSGSAYEYFSVDYDGTTLGKMALFLHDDQGTTTRYDDYFEAVARYEYMEIRTDDLFMAFELPENGEYFLVLTPAYSSLYDPTDNNTYKLTMRLASSDDMLDGALDGDAGLPIDEEIAYVSNVVADHNNLLGANIPKQLVYLNFDGGAATKYEQVDDPVPVEAFDLAEIDPSLSGYEDAIINGSGAVVGIVDHVLTVFTDIPASHPLGALNAVRITTEAQWLAATEGLYFTTVDPENWSLDPETDFTTVFIGNADDTLLGVTGDVGLASDIDLASQTLADNAIVFSQNFEGMSTASGTEDRLNEYSHLLANTVAHELGHTLGLNHQPTSGFVSTDLVSDDPDNDPLTPNDSNTGAALMAYPPLDDELADTDQLGTAPLAMDEFPIGHLDTAELLLRWLS